MELSVFEMYILIMITGIFILILKRDSKKYAETQNITRLDDGNDEHRREFIASGISDYKYAGAKILVIMYSLYCRKCMSSNIFAEISEDKEHVQVICRDCGYITLIPLKKMLINEVLDDINGDIDEELAKKYIKKINKDHEVDIIDSDEDKSHKHE